MEASRTSATAMLVGTRDVEKHAQATTISVPREEIEEALASDASPELILEVQLGNAQPRDLHVAWERGDLETVLAATGPGGITFAFEPTEIYRALEHPDFEGHGLREAVLLTVAAASASAALAATTAHAGIAEGTGIGGGATAAVVAPGHDEASTASTVAGGTAVTPGHDEAGTAGTLAAAAAVNDEAGATARGIGVTIPGADEATLAARGIAQPAVAVGHDEAGTAGTLANPAAVNDEVGATARGIGITMPGADEATLAARGIEPAPATHDEATLVERGVQAAPAAVDSGTSIDLPSVDPGTAAVIGGLAGAGLLIVGGTFVARRRVGTA
jgi:hypothetical protein